MKQNKTQKKLLQITLIINLVILIPLLIRKPPVKDWIIVYLFNAATNGLIDNILSKHKIVKYPVRLFSKSFDTHIMFDFFLYPTFTILYNQMTQKDKIPLIIYKLIFITIPPFLIELWAEKNTNLIEWSRKWKWYHTFLGLIFKSLLTRTVIGVVRKLDIQIN
ncbi:CBO0543 family protein [Rossellomorea vietnamensis]|uniref:CBO0543 family protein n=1 Tax=Rossellomorea vietnamensis TaxID=218284 RepID=UPI003CF35717